MGNSSKITEFTNLKNFNLNTKTVDNKTIIIVLLEGAQAHFDRLWPKYNPQGHMETLQILLRAGVDPSIACPTLEAVTFRNIFALRHMFRRMNISSIIYCISVRDSNGDNLLGAASKSTSAGLSRIVFRASRLERNDTGRAVLNRHLSLTIPEFTLTNEISKTQLETCAGTPEMDILLETLHDLVAQYHVDNPIVVSQPKTSGGGSSTDDNSSSSAIDSSASVSKLSMDEFSSTIIGNYSMRNLSSIILPLLNNRNNAGFTPFLISCAQGRTNAIKKYLSLSKLMNQQSMEFLVHQTILPKAEEVPENILYQPTFAPTGSSCIPIAISRGYVDILKEIYQVMGKDIFRQKIEYNIHNPVSNNLLLCDWTRTLGIVYQPVIKFLESIGACPLDETILTSLWEDDEPAPSSTVSSPSKHPLVPNQPTNELLTSKFYPNVQRKGIQINHFQLTHHTDGGWRALSPSQLESLRLPGTLFDKSSDTVLTPSLCNYGYPIDSLPLDEVITDSKHIYEQCITHSRPFIIEKAFNPTDLFSDSVTTRRRNSNEKYDYITKDKFLRYYDSLPSVLTGDVPYAQSYGSIGKNMNIRTFIDSYMGIGTSSSSKSTAAGGTSTAAGGSKRKLSAATPSERPIRSNSKAKSIKVDNDGTQTVTASDGNATNSTVTDTVQPSYAIGPGSELYLPPYIFDNQVISKQATLFQTYVNWVPVTLGKGKNVTWSNLKQFILGPAYSGAPPHFHLEAVNTLFLGVKLWLLFPPAYASFANDHVLTWYKQTYLNRFNCYTNRTKKMTTDDDSNNEDDHENFLISSSTTFLSSSPSNEKNNKVPDTPILNKDELRVPHYAFIQEPGDLVYIPPLWGHAILNLADSFAIAIE